MRFLVDEMLPPALAVRLTSLGYDAVDVREVGLGNHPDEDILDSAIHADRVVITENVADFTSLVVERLRDGRPATAVILVRRGLGPSGLIVDRLARALDAWATANPDPWDGPHWLTLDGD